MAHRFAERFHQAVAEHAFESGGHSACLTVSLGVATYPFHAEVTSPELLVYLADQALLEAKAAGRNRIMAWHDLSLEQRATIRRRLSSKPYVLEQEIASEMSCAT